MRLKILFKASSLPVGYRMMMVSILKQAIRDSDENYYKELYEDQVNKIKPYGFSIYLRNYTYTNEEIYLEGFTMTLSSQHYPLLMHVFNGLQGRKKHDYKQYGCEVERIEMLPQKQITKEKVLFRTLSPVLIEDKNGKPLAPTDESYEQEFNHYTENMVQALDNRSLIKPLKVIPGRMKKIVVKERDFQGGNRAYYFTAYHGLLLLEGDPKDLQLIYDQGVSRRLNQGFGLLEIESQEVK